MCPLQGMKLWLAGFEQRAVDEHLVPGQGEPQLFTGHADDVIAEDLGVVVLQHGKVGLVLRLDLLNLLAQLRVLRVHLCGGLPAVQGAEPRPQHEQRHRRQHHQAEHPAALGRQPAQQ